jgi:hypothetical protein
MYTNLVVIVNEAMFVDKSEFINKIIGLAGKKLVGQGLYPAGMIVGQKCGCGESRGFSTSHPVDIQRLIHRWLGEAAASLPVPRP